MLSVNRRKFIRGAALAGGAFFLRQTSFAIPASPDKSAKPLRIGMISDLHHLQFGQDEEKRITAFMDAVMIASPDFIIQCGDFCRPEGSDGIMQQWNRFKGPKHHVLGNHDMDVCSKQKIMQLWGMRAPYYSFDLHGFHFVIMDRNYFKKEDGSLADYDTGNWGNTATTRSFTDAAQLEWLKADLAATAYPVIVFMHQPVFISDFFQEIGNAPEILSIFDEVNLQAAEQGKSNRVAAVFMGHDHVDRYGERNGVHYFILNSASYAYRGKAWFYKDCLYSFLTLDPAGKLSIAGTESSFVTTPPDHIRALFPTKISSRELRFPGYAASK
ncbi:metallophosphoesterase family protein [Chitinophaga arvensicola]|uniref:3',5'-cyclic AMP phosphodiesterase CpdA n=1 Tax=Chitinophaga arvensicola TaxID=29529 RepID=A0A1I0RTM4_9BACT|nr:metallophosphoesterase [Chitinophaga arvensicola]SEW44678.1 3',5'-cyclic AMP phosphodiesterase CpdA [Chitinophaga arvensicola]